MISQLLKKYNELRKRKIFSNSLFHTKKKYAFVGIGIHSLSNYYPILKHFNINVKYVHTRKSNWDVEIGRIFPNTKYTHSLTEIIEDPEVEGVLVCADPSAHFALVSELLKHNKNVFVEKPPCTNLSELNQLIAQNKDSVCKIGFQRRYWPGNKHILPRIGKAKTYTYRFHFGPYGQGDPYTELFVHALDYCNHLFGNYKVNSHTESKNDNGITVQLHVTHDSLVSGLIELSTDYSWKDPIDEMEINSKTEWLTIRYPSLVMGKQKPRRFLNIPSERLIGGAIDTKIYFNLNNLVIPSIDLNTIAVQGFFKELETFFSLVESPSQGVVKNDLPGLVNLYEVLHALKNQGASTA